MANVLHCGHSRVCAQQFYSSRDHYFKQRPPYHNLSFSCIEHRTASYSPSPEKPQHGAAGQQAPRCVTTSSRSGASATGCSSSRADSGRRGPEETHRRLCPPDNGEPHLSRAHGPLSRNTTAWSCTGDSRHTASLSRVTTAGIEQLQAAPGQPRALT